MILFQRAQLFGELLEALEQRRHGDGPADPPCQLLVELQTENLARLRCFVVVFGISMFDLVLGACCLFFFVVFGFGLWRLLLDFLDLFNLFDYFWLGLGLGSERWYHSACAVQRQQMERQTISPCLTPHHTGRAALGGGAKRGMHTIVPTNDGLLPLA
ncbi:hypothetical protein VDGD_21401 [Verticillium dahliae]|nr:hypothetical protein VDGD_21401 [Verticillium dahliae]